MGPSARTSVLIGGGDGAQRLTLGENTGSQEQAGEGMPRTTDAGRRQGTGQISSGTCGLETSPADSVSDLWFPDH